MDELKAVQPSENNGGQKQTVPDTPDTCTPAMEHKAVIGKSWSYKGIPGKKDLTQNVRKN